MAPGLFLQKPPLQVPTIITLLHKPNTNIHITIHITITYTELYNAFLYLLSIVILSLRSSRSELLNTCVTTLKPENFAKAIYFVFSWFTKKMFNNSSKLVLSSTEKYVRRDELFGSLTDVIQMKARKRDKFNFAWFFFFRVYLKYSIAEGKNYLKF